MNRILVVRGGALGDFILTLPAVKAVREAYPNGIVEILGYRHIAGIAEQRFYADRVRSIEYGPLSGFFVKNAKLDQDLREYFRSFNLVISYLFDPDGIFKANLERSGVSRVVVGPSKIRPGLHAARQLAAPIRDLGIEVNDFAPKVFPAELDRTFARDFLGGLPPGIIALHPGSGSPGKNWPLPNWIAVGDRLLGENNRLVIVAGEADQPQRNILEQHWRRPDVRFAHNLPLPSLAAILAETVFVGHDSGISHLAAASGAKCVVLFGPTDPALWAPVGDNVEVIRGPNAHLGDINPELVVNAIARISGQLPV